MNIGFRVLCTALALISVSPCAADLSAAAGEVESFALTVGQAERSYLLFTPAGLKPGSPLVIAFHPSDSSGPMMRSMSGRTLERIARARGFAIAYPNGFEGHFDDCRRAAPYSAKTQKIDDVGFSRAIVSQVARRYGIDTARVYDLGYSNGGQMALRLALEAPDLVAGVVVISANLPVPANNDCEIRDGRPVSVVLIEGTNDNFNPYTGGNVSFRGMGGRGEVMSALASAQWFASRYGAAARRDPPPELRAGLLNARWQDWGSENVVVRLITIEGGGHTIPQAESGFLPLALGSAFRSDVPLESAFDALLGEK